MYLERALRHGVLGSDGDLLALLGNSDEAGQLTRLAAIDLDTVVQVLLERVDVENCVIDWLGAVDGELDRLFGDSRLLALQERHRTTAHGGRATRANIIVREHEYDNNIEREKNKRDQH